MNIHDEISIYMMATVIITPDATAYRDTTILLYYVIHVTYNLLWLGYMMCSGYPK